MYMYRFVNIVSAVHRLRASPWTSLKIDLLENYYPQKRVTDLRWVIGQIKEQTHVVHGAILLKVLFEESSRLHIHLMGIKKNNNTTLWAFHNKNIHKSHCNSTNLIATHTTYLGQIWTWLKAFIIVYELPQHPQYCSGALCFCWHALCKVPIQTYIFLIKVPLSRGKLLCHVKSEVQGLVLVVFSTSNHFSKSSK